MTTPNEPSAPASAASAAAAAEAAGDDPLARLHKMSTTAGVASQQYVAINAGAVVAALLGVASALALFSSLLLVIPLAGIIVACVAWRHIANSNGTETGKPLAIIGLLLSLLLGGGIFGKEIADRIRAHADAQQMQAIADQFTQRIQASNYGGAYELFTPAFQQRVSPDQFKARWEALQQSGALRSLKWNGVLPVYESIEGGQGLAGVVSMAVDFQDREGRYIFVFRKAGDAWRLENLPDIFPIERAQRRK
jgi:hypothetical protein